MLKVVIDTNNFISSLINRKGPSAQLIKLWQHGYFTLVICDPIIEEIRRVLTYPRLAKKYKLQQDDIEVFIRLLEQEAVILSDLPDVKVIEDDPDGNKFIACALRSGAEYIVSGDKHLLELAKFKKVSIITVRDFLKLFHR